MGEVALTKEQRMTIDEAVAVEVMYLLRLARNYERQAEGEALRLMQRDHDAGCRQRRDQHRSSAAEYRQRAADWMG